jgi:hypothetical protein
MRSSIPRAAEASNARVDPFASPRRFGLLILRGRLEDDLAGALPTCAIR